MPLVASDAIHWSATQGMLSCCTTCRRSALVAAALAAAASTTRPRVACAAEPSLRQLSLPLSWAGTWRAQRCLNGVTGDEGSAEQTWRALGGNGQFEIDRPESYTVQFQRAPLQEAALPDRRQEICSRCQLPETKATWADDVLTFERPGIGRYALRVVQRQVFPPGSSLGATELLRVRRSASTQSKGFERGVRLTTSYRITDAGIIEIKEVVKTYDSSYLAELEELEGAVAAEPTSKAVSRVSLTPVVRPYGDPVRRRPAYAS